MTKKQAQELEKELLLKAQQTEDEAYEACSYQFQHCGTACLDCEHFSNVDMECPYVNKQKGESK